MFAITSAVGKWRHYLLGSHFIIKTDHKSLKNLLTQSIQTPEQQIFLCKRLGFDFSIIYKPGKENVVADALSRSFEEDKEEEIIFTSNSLGCPGSLLSITGPIPTLLEELKVENHISPYSRDLLQKHSTATQGL